MAIMMHRNKILSLVLIVSIFFSALVSFFVLDIYIADIPVRTVVFTGDIPFAEGHVNMSIVETLNIDVDSLYNTLNFGTCKPGVDGLFVDLGNNVVDGSSLNNCSQDNMTPQYIVVHNIGNVDANITLTAECNVSDFIGSPNSDLNVSSVGCAGGDMANLTLLDSEFYVCSNLTRMSGFADEFNITASVWITNDATGGVGLCSDFQNQITFTARKI